MSAFVPFWVYFSIGNQTMNLTVEDVTELFNVSEKTIYRWIKANGLPAYRVNNQYRFNRSDLLEWASARRVNMSPALLTADGAARSEPLPGLFEALTAGGVFYGIGGRDKASVLREMVELLRLPERVDREGLFQILLAREEMGSTAIGDGIAIPHARNPIVLNVTRPSITVCFLKRPIDFDALDGKPVQVLFTLISPTINVHLHLLSRLSYVLRSSGFKNAIARQAEREEILAEAARVEDTLKAETASPGAKG
jgi:PTS system nitrogen regulatory IIA component